MPKVPRKISADCRIMVLRIMVSTLLDKYDNKNELIYYSYAFLRKYNSLAMLYFMIRSLLDSNIYYVFRSKIYIINIYYKIYIINVQYIRGFILSIFF